MYIGVEIWSVFFHFSYQFSEQSFAHVSRRSVNTASPPFCLYPEAAAVYLAQVQICFRGPGREKTGARSGPDPCTAHRCPVWPPSVQFFRVRAWAQLLGAGFQSQRDQIVEALSPDPVFELGFYFWCILLSSGPVGRKTSSPDLGSNGVGLALWLTMDKLTGKKRFIYRYLQEYSVIG